MEQKELKTLKDLDSIIWVNGEAESVIKQEAIKHIKSNKVLISLHDSDEGIEFTVDYYKAQNDWIKKFFNIKGSEL